MRTFGVGVLGLHEGRTMLGALTRTKHARAVAACDINPAKIAEARARYPDIFYTTSYDELLERPEVDIVAIFTPDQLHGEHILRAFAAGKHVICTKPLVNTVADARRILEASRESKSKLLVGQSTRFFEPFLRQRRDYERGKLGAVELVDAHYIHRMDWFYDKSPWAASATDWAFLGLSHPVDLVYWYLGPFVSVHARGARSALAEEYQTMGYDIYIAHLEAHDGRLARVMGHYGLHELPIARNHIELLLFGTRGTSLAQYPDMRYLYTLEDGTHVSEDPLYRLRYYYFNNEVHGMHYGEFANYTDYFAIALRDEHPYSPNLLDGLEVFCIMEGLRRSAQRQGEQVTLDTIRVEIGLTPLMRRDNP